MNAERTEEDWKLKLRSREMKTPFQHYTVLAAGIVRELRKGYTCPEGDAWMGMKIWDYSTGDAGAMITAVGRQIGFTVTGEIRIYKTEPAKPPGDKPFGYDITFTPFRGKSNVV